MTRGGEKKDTPDMCKRARVSRPTSSDIAKVKAQRRMLDGVPSLGGPTLPKIANVRIGEDREMVDLDKYFGFLEENARARVVGFICGYENELQKESATTALAAILQNARDPEVFWALFMAAEAIFPLKDGDSGSLKLLDKAVPRAADKGMHDPILCTVGHFRTQEFAEAHEIIAAAPNAGIHFPSTMFKMGIYLGGDKLEEITNTIVMLRELSPGPAILLAPMYLGYRSSLEAIVKNRIDPELVSLISDTAISLKDRGKGDEYITSEFLDIIAGKAASGNAGQIRHECAMQMEE